MEPQTSTTSDAELMSQDYSYVPFDVSIAFIALASVAYALRFGARYVKHIPFAWDDLLIAPAFVFQIALNVCSMLSATYGSGRHAVRVLSENDWHFTYWGIYNLYVIPCLYQLCVTLPKLSILVLYLRIFPNRFSRWCCWLVAFVLIANVITEYITIFLQCDQLDLAWQSWEYAGNCDNITLHFTLANLPNIVTDLIMLLLPLPAIWKLPTDWYTKVGVWLMLLLGSFGMVTSVLRLVDFIQNDWSQDGTWFAGTLLTWTVAETNMYFISACLITYRPLLHLLLQRSGMSRVFLRPKGGSHPSKSLPTAEQRRSSVLTASLDPNGGIEQGYGPDVKYSYDIRAQSLETIDSPERAHFWLPLQGRPDDQSNDAPRTGSIVTDITRLSESNARGPSRSWLQRPSMETRETRTELESRST